MKWAKPLIAVFNKIKNLQWLPTPLFVSVKNKWGRRDARIAFAIVPGIGTNKVIRRVLHKELKQCIFMY
jgi:hypothetical protein